MASLDYLLMAKRKRHVMGGVLLSTSLLFAGLAFTIISMKHDEKEIDDNEKYIG